MDSKNAVNVFSILKELSQEQTLFLLIVTHDTDFTTKTDRIIEMAEGKTLNQMTKRFSIQSDKIINSSTIFF